MAITLIEMWFSCKHNLKMVINVAVICQYISTRYYIFTLGVRSCIYNDRI